MKNEEELDDFLEKFEEIQQKAAPIATALFKQNGYDIRVDSDEIHLQGGSLYAVASYHDRFGDWIEREQYIPTGYLFEDDFAAKIEEEIRLKKEEEKRLEAEKLAEEKKERKAKADKAEYIKYLKLKQKYEGDYDE